MAALRSARQPARSAQRAVTTAASTRPDRRCHQRHAHAKDVFDDHATELGELFAAPAAVAVHNAQLLAQAVTLAAQLRSALSTRPVIDQAIGLLRGRTGGTAEEAFTRLRVISQRDHVKLADVAQHLLDDAVGRARARHREQ